MNPLLRWARFNAVGVLGMGVQLAALAAFNRLFAGHYLLATCAALELTLLHNFCWHRRFTWRDRPTVPGALVRFHLANGLISLAGNLLLMRVLVMNAHLPLLAANAIAISCCSLANFWLGSCWAFPANPTPIHGCVSERVSMQNTLLLMLVLGAGTSAMQGQDLPAAPLPAPHRSGGLGTDSAYANVFLDAGVSHSAGSARPSVLGGVTFGQYFARTWGEGAALSPQFELGLIGPVHGGPPLDGVASFNLMLGNQLPDRHVYTFFTAGYTRVLVTGNAVNAGLGVDFGKDEYRRVTRLELRDYYLFSGSPQNILSLRLGLGKFIHD